MRDLWRLILPAAAAGLALGLGSGLRWISVQASRPQGSAWECALPWPQSLAIPVLLALVAVVAALGLWRAYRPGRRAALLLIILPAAAASVYSLLHWVVSASSRVGGWHVLAPPVTALLLAALLAASGRLRPAFVTLLVAAGLTPWVHSVDAITGDAVMLAAASYALPDAWPALNGILWPLAYLGALTGAAAALLAAGPLGWAALYGAGCGAGAAACVAAAQAATAVAAMGSGHSPLAILAAPILIWVGLASTISAAVHAWMSPPQSWTYRYSPAIAVLIVAAYVAHASYGASTYRATTLLHQDVNYAYIHFDSNGTWCRTLDAAGQETRLWRLERFLATYPRSAYRPAAMLQKAECEFELWRFEDALRTLDDFALDYPHQRGYPGVLRVLAGTAAGRPDAVLGAASQPGSLTTWAQGQGALIVAAAADRLGMPLRATGLYSAHINYLAAQQPTAWTARSIAYTNARMDELRRRADGDAAPRSHGLVAVRVMAGDRPVRDARVVLVQPHRSAVLPADSIRFTGAWTVPAWNGHWALTGGDGIAIIRQVPRGEYEVVLGLNAKTTPRGFVASSAVPPVTVSDTAVRLPDIVLRPALRLQQPQARGVLPSGGYLTWEAYPGAARYSVTIIECGERRRTTTITRPKPAGASCWARSNIKEPCTHVDAAHFLNGHTGLQPGEGYLWVVYAYGPDGQLLSSSEHYFDLREPVFVAQ